MTRIGLFTARKSVANATLSSAYVFLNPLSCVARSSTARTAFSFGINCFQSKACRHDLISGLPSLRCESLHPVVGFLSSGRARPCDRQKLKTPNRRRVTVAARNFSECISPSRPASRASQAFDIIEPDPPAGSLNRKRFVAIAERLSQMNTSLLNGRKARQNPPSDTRSFLADRF